MLCVSSLRSLCQANSLARMIPGMGMILDPVVYTAMKPVIDIVVNMLTPDVMDTMAEQANQEYVTQGLLIRF